MRKTFALNTEPHVAEIPGLGLELQFLAEVMGDEYLDAYAEMRETQKRESGVDVEDLDAADVEQLRKVTTGLRVFLSRLMLPESAALITRVDVVEAGKTLKSFQSWEEAREHADGVEGGGAKPAWNLRLPDRTLLQLLDWTVELYTGGRRPPTSSGGSAGPSPKAGTRGTGASRSRGSARTTGR
ncbi:hypothetical protein ACFC09_15610 [Streptomyces sp. NPDC056161]|uniref:hypothetical protein n=1 Tax=Streptomyces sp. NPDC056161 TaxID=3345732 RepID=UPI0035DB5AE0